MAHKKRFTRKQKRRLQRKSKKESNKSEGGYRFTTSVGTLLLGMLAGVSGNYCTRDTRKYAERFLGSGAQSVVTSDNELTGAQKIFPPQHIKRAAVVLELENRGLYAPTQHAPCYIHQPDGVTTVITSKLLPISGEDIVDANGRPKPGWEKAWSNFRERVQEFEKDSGSKAWDVAVFKDDGSGEIDFGYRPDDPRLTDRFHHPTGTLSSKFRLNRGNFRADKDKNIYITDSDWISGTDHTVIDQLIGDIPVPSPFGETPNMSNLYLRPQSDILDTLSPVDVPRY
jgi:hypothetical protein